jgi:hypothetical protein
LRTARAYSSQNPAVSSRCATSARCSAVTKRVARRFDLPGESGVNC